MGHAPLNWTETLTARAPLHREGQAHQVPPGVPLLRVTRITSNPDGQILEVNDTRISAGGSRSATSRTPPKLTDGRAVEPGPRYAQYRAPSPEREALGSSDPGMAGARAPVPAKRGLSWTKWVTASASAACGGV